MSVRHARLMGMTRRPWRRRAPPAAACAPVAHRRPLCRAGLPGGGGHRHRRLP